MTTVKYTLDEFVHDMERLLEEQPDQQKIFDTGANWLEKLIRNPDSIPVAYRVPTGTGNRPNHGSYLLHQGGNGLQVTAVVWGA